MTPAIWRTITNWLRPHARADVAPVTVAGPYDPFANMPWRAQVAPTTPNISLNYPPEVADIAEETLARYMRYAERTKPDWTPSEQRYLAVMLAEANLSERAAFRREISEYTR